MNKSKPKVILKFESDWHVGTGTGIPGSTDRLLFRDIDGFPACPAKTLNGIWRDAMETLCEGLGDGWSKWAEFIFGNQPAMQGANPTVTPFQSVLTLQPAQIPKKLQEAIGGDEKLKQALTFIKPGIEIENETGTAKENCLRFEEMGRSGTVLEAGFELQTDDKTAQALLVLSAELIERIGGKRRRGAGQCKFKVGGLITKNVALKHLETLAAGDAPNVPKIKGKTYEIDLKKSGKSTEWQTLGYRLTLHTPVSIVTAVLGNVSESLDFIPGTYLLPHVTKHFGKEIRTAVANGDFQVSPATIEIDGEGGLPIPKIFAKEKIKQENKEKEEIYNRLHEPLEGKKQTKPIREGYISKISSTTLSLATTPKTLLIHNTVDDLVQRPTSDVGGVFSRQAIKAGTVLRGEIRWKKGIVKEDFNFGQLKSSVRLGTSKKDDYGLAEFEVLGKPKDSASMSKLNSGKDKDKLYVYLASDVLLRNNNLRQTNLVEDLAKELSKKLGLRLTQTKAEKGLISSLIQVRRIESWQTGWGFPRPTLIAMSTGSVAVFKSDKKLNLDDLKNLETAGIGERRGEGYGRIIFNPKLLKTLNPDWQNGELTQIKKFNKKSVLKDEFARQLEITAWHEELKVAVLKIAANPAKRNEIFGFVNNSGTLSMSQIGGLRSVISRLKSTTEEEKQRTKKIVSDWIEHLENTKNRFNSWGKERLDNVKNVLQDNNIWTILGDFFKEPQSLTGRDLKKELWADAVRALFYACQHAHKRDLEKPKQKAEAANG